MVSLAKLQALVYNMLPSLEEGAIKRYSRVCSLAKFGVRGYPAFLFSFPFFFFFFIVHNDAPKSSSSDPVNHIMPERQVYS